MAHKKDERNSKGVAGNISFKHYDRVLKFCRMYDLPLSRLVAIAIENELERDAPFKINLKLPEGQYVENSFADQAGKIYKFMKTLRTGIELDFAYVLRHDIGIPDKDEFLAGFNECLQQGMIEKFEAPRSVKYIHNQGIAYLYRAKINAPEVRKKILKKAKTKEQKFAEYQKLKKEFEKPDYN